MGLNILMLLLKLFNMFIALYFILQGLQSVSSISVPPVWVTNSYVQSAVNHVINGNITGMVADSSVTPAATIPFATAFTTAPNLAYGIMNYEGNDGMSI